MGSARLLGMIVPDSTNPYFAELTDAIAQADTARQITHDQLSRSTIKDEIKRDKLQQEILEPLLPLMQPGNTSTNVIDTTVPPK